MLVRLCAAIAVCAALLLQGAAFVRAEDMCANAEAYLDMARSESRAGNWAAAGVTARSAATQLETCARTREGSNYAGTLVSAAGAHVIYGLSIVKGGGARDNAEIRLAYALYRFVAQFPSATPLQRRLASTKAAAMLRVSPALLYHVSFDRVPRPLQPATAVVALRPASSLIGAMKDIWTTSVYSYADRGGGPGGGRADDELRVGGWGDAYYALLQFDLEGLPRVARSAKLRLYNGAANGGSPTGVFVYRITAPWDWTARGSGPDRERLWWADQPGAALWSGPFRAPNTYEYYEIDVTALYNAWQSRQFPNYGLELRPVSMTNAFDQFRSSRAADAAQRPKLVVVAAPT